MSGRIPPCGLGAEVAGLQRVEAERLCYGVKVYEDPTSAGHLHQPLPAHHHSGLLLPTPKYSWRSLEYLSEITALCMPPAMALCLLAPSILPPTHSAPVAWNLFPYMPETFYCRAFALLSPPRSLHGPTFPELAWVPFPKLTVTLGGGLWHV